MALVSHMLKGNVKCVACCCYSYDRLLSCISTNDTKRVYRYTLNEPFILKNYRAYSSIFKHQPLTFNINKVCFYSQNSSNKTSGTGITEKILKKKYGESADNTESPVEQSTEKEQNRSGNKSSEEDKSKSNSWFSQKHGWKIGLIVLGGSAVLLGVDLLYIWGAPIRDPEGNEIRDEFSDMPNWQAYPRRFVKEFTFMKKMIQEPSSKKLLPDPLKEPYYQPPYTLVLEMTGILIHPDWTLSTGWRFKKRPHIDYLLQNAGPPLFEVVIYTKEQGMTAFPIVDGIDPNGFISYRLFRDATLYKNGEHCKDLSCLNRDQSKVIIVDCDPKAVQLQPRNAVTLKKWKGEDGDKSLIDLANFLRTVAMSGVDDVRTVLDHYNQFDDPLEAFKERQAQLQAQMEASKSPEQSKSKLLSSWTPGFSRRRGH